VIATVTVGWIAGLIGLAVVLALLVVALVIAVKMRPNVPSDERWMNTAWIVVFIIMFPVTLGVWWMSSAFTTSGDYHAWNVKTGTVSEVSKRIVPAGDKGIQERFVVRLREAGGLYGIDDTRASLLKSGDEVRLKCKKDYQWGVDRSAHGWACRWAMPEVTR
jgi:hypothetical protein